MKIQLFHGDIGDVTAEGLFCPVDGDICVLGGPAAATALKNSFDAEERDELFGYLEKDVKRLCPIPHGAARIIDGEGQWDWLVVLAALPHHVNDAIITEDHFAHILERSIINGIHTSCEKAIKSIAMTVIGSSYRLSTEVSIRSAVKAICKCRRENIKIIWSFLDEDQLALAAESFSQLGVRYIRKGS